MKYSTLAILTAVGSAAAQGVTTQISPSAGPPAGCSSSYSGLFEITVVNVQNAKRDYAIKVSGPRDHADPSPAGVDGQLAIT